MPFWQRYKGVKTGLIGCGNISSVYLENSRWLKDLHIVACTDAIPERAQEAANTYRIASVNTVDELLEDPAIRMIINLTPPAAHGEIAIRVVEAGKSVYNEKPLAIEREEAKGLLTLAEQRGQRVGCAPDTFMGAAHQTCRRLVDEGAIGKAVAGTAFCMNHGHEGWHPDPAFFYKAGGGPLFDMGPYYLTALINLMGPVRRVSASAQTTFPERTIESDEKKGDRIAVEVPTHLSGTLQFANGALVTMIMSFDVWGHKLPWLELHGTEGSLSIPDPNFFGGDVKLLRAGEEDWIPIKHTHRYTENCRGLGPADLANALNDGRPHRATGAMAFHVLDTMHAFHESAEKSRAVDVGSTCPRPDPMPANPKRGCVD